MCMCHNPIARLELKVKVIGQGLRLGLAAESNACGRGNAVGLTSVFDREQFLVVNCAFYNQ